jgi:hypothetical protein
VFAEEEIPASYLGNVTKEQKLIIENREESSIIVLPLAEIKDRWKNRMEEEMEGKKK